MYVCTTVTFCSDVSAPFRPSSGLLYGYSQMHIIPVLKDCVTVSHLVESWRYQRLSTPSVCPEGHWQTRMHAGTHARTHALPFTLRLAVLFLSQRLHILARWRNCRSSCTCPITRCVNSSIWFLERCFSANRTYSVRTGSGLNSVNFLTSERQPTSDELCSVVGIVGVSAVTWLAQCKGSVLTGLAQCQD